MHRHPKTRMGLHRNWNRRVHLLDVGFGEKSCILVAGSARSGTTWIGNVIAEATRSRQIFEPFLQDGTFNFAIRSAGVPIFDHYQPYVPADSEPRSWQRELDRILRGDFRHWWCDRFTRVGIYRRRVIKAVRINLMLDWLASYRPQLKIVFVVRNPVSTVNSQISKMKQGWVMGWKPEYVLSQPLLMSDWLEPYRHIIESVDSIPQQQAVKWCIENLQPLATLPHRRNVMIVKYDQLVQGSEPWEQVADFLADRHWDKSRFDQAVTQVSGTAERSPQQISQQIEELSELSADDQRAIAAIVRTFGLGEYLQPNTNQLNAA